MMNHGNADAFNAMLRSAGIRTTARHFRDRVYSLRCRPDVLLQVLALTGVRLEGGRPVPQWVADEIALGCQRSATFHVEWRQPK